MAEIVYILCAVTSITCAVLLFRGYLVGRSRLLFWSSLCFVGLAVNNVVLVIDLLVIPETDLSLLRTCTSLVAMTVLVLGLVLEEER
jgi:hypothetical protein